jgi:phage FluMu protein Com
MKEFKIDPKLLKEYRCPVCHKLLGKGHLTHKDDYLEVKCRGCKSICLLSGEHAKILETRAKLLKKGLIPDTE